MAFSVPEKYRIKTGFAASDDGYGNNGAFYVKLNHGQHVFVVASDKLGWEHVSVSRQDRTPTWSEMCQVKEMFWNGDNDCVVQYHPQKKDYINNHPNCLHLWRPVGIEIPKPPKIMVGI